MAAIREAITYIWGDYGAIYCPVPTHLDYPPCTRSTYDLEAATLACMSMNCLCKKGGEGGGGKEETRAQTL